MSFVRLDDTWLQVTMTYEADWNVAAFPASSPLPLQFSYVGWFANATGGASGDSYFYQGLWQPGTVVFAYRVRKADIAVLATPSFDTIGWMRSADPYVVTGAVVRASTPYGAS